MDIKQDYVHFCLENNELINELKRKKTLTYDFLNPVFVVMDYLASKNLHVDGEDDKDVLDVFSIGFRHLFNAVDIIKRILKENYDEDIDELAKYDQNLYLYLRADELDTLLDQENEMISAILDRLLEYLEYHKHLDKTTLKAIEDELEKAATSTDDYTVTDQFLDFADVLDLDII